MEAKRTTNWQIQLGRYDKIEEVYFAYTQLGVQGIGFRIADAINNKAIQSFGLMHYNFAMKLKPHEYITKLSSTISSEPQKAIKLLKIHTNLLPQGKSGRDELQNKVKEDPKLSKKSIEVQTLDDIIVEIYGRPLPEEMKKGETYILTDIGVVVKELYFKPETLQMWGKKSNKLQHQNLSVELERYGYIKEIMIAYEDKVDDRPVGYICGIGFVIVDALGNPTTTEWIGKKDAKSHKITLKLNEHIVRITGTYEYNSEDDMSIEDCVITSLKIHTDFWRSGYKLCENSAPNQKFRRSEDFSILVQPDEFIENIFFTHNDTHLTSIGIVVKKPHFKERNETMGIDSAKEEEHHE